MENYLQQTHVLPDGRQLGYDILGDYDGQPMFYFHGFPSSKIEARGVSDMAKALHIKLIALDRPGLGQSDFKPNRKLLDWPDDVVSIADALGFEKFSVVGVSGGGPYLLSCAYKIPHRLNSAGIVCGLGPITEIPNIMSYMKGINYIGLQCAQKMPWLISPIMAILTPIIKHNPEFLLNMMSGQVSGKEKTALQESEVLDLLIQATISSFDNGHQGITTDLIIYTSPWGFHVDDIEMPVHLWYSEADTLIPIIIGQYLEQHLKHPKAVYFTDEGHLSIVINQFSSIMKTLIDQ